MVVWSLFTPSKVFKKTLTACKIATITVTIFHQKVILKILLSCYHRRTSSCGHPRRCHSITIWASLPERKVCREDSKRVCEHISHMWWRQMGIKNLGWCQSSWRNRVSGVSFWGWQNIWIIHASDEDCARDYAGQILPATILDLLNKNITFHYCIKMVQIDLEFRGSASLLFHQDTCHRNTNIVRGRL